MFYFVFVLWRYYNLIIQFNAGSFFKAINQFQYWNAASCTDIEKVWANPDYANQELGWKAVETLEDTLRSAWNWQLKLRERGIQ